MADDNEPTGSHVDPGKPFERDTNYITTRITADGADGWKVAPGRYHLVVAHACPWANRAMIVRRLLGLEGALDGHLRARARLAKLDLRPRPRRPRSSAGHPPPARRLPARLPRLPQGHNRAALVDILSGGVVTNDFAQITLDLSTEWKEFHRPGAPDLYPEALRSEIDEINDLVYRDVNNGVYRAGFAGSQESYEAAYHRLFDRLDWLSERLATRRFLVGDTITEADIRLWVSLVRFDAVYHGHFKCNRQKLTEMPVLWAYAAICSRRPGSARRSTSIRSSGTTTRSTPT